MVGVSRIRGHSLRMQSRPFKTEMRRNFFTQRVVSLWNLLPQKVVKAKTLNVFEKQLDIALEAKIIKGYGEGEGRFRLLSSMISHDHNEWWSRLEGPNGLLLLLVSM